MEILITLLIGAVAGWLGSMIYKGGGLGLLGNIVVGILGSYVGYWIFGKLGLSLGTALLGQIVTGAFGAIVILFLINIIMGKKR